MARSTLVAPAFTGKKQHNFWCFVLLFVWTVWQDSLIGKERMSQSMGVRK
jgi:hypothetical protein